MYKAEEVILKIENLSVGYKDKSGNVKMILKDVNLSENDIIRDGVQATGQAIAIIGRSGRGKSTLFKCLTGLLKPISGQILLNNFNLETKEDLKIVSEGSIGFVDQRYTLFRHKTVMQVCRYAIRKSDISKEEKEKLINEGLNNWELFEHRNKYPNELSGGQKQRTAILEQILTSKKIMILDEPTSGLDSVAINMVKNSFNKILNSNEYNTIIFSTHNIEFAVEMADSIYVIGFPEDSKEYSTIIKHYDLKAMGMAWQEFGLNHLNLVKEIKDVLAKS